MDNIFLHDWASGSIIDIVAAFEGIHMTSKDYAAAVSPWANESYWLEEKARLEDALKQLRWKTITRILLASYSYENHKGEAYVLFRSGLKLREVQASHCQRYDLEGQWVASDVTKQDLLHRLNRGTLGKGGPGGVGSFEVELREVANSINGFRANLEVARD